MINLFWPNCYGFFLQGGNGCIMSGRGVRSESGHDESGTVAPGQQMPDPLDVRCTQITLTFTLIKVFKINLDFRIFSQAKYNKNHK